MPTLYVVDGNSLLFRAFYATMHGAGPMATKDGTPTNAIFAFSRMLSTIVASLKEGDYLFVAFDADGDTFRKEELSSYKANRAPCPEELKPQFPISREFLASIGAFYYELHGYEADDLAGTVARWGEKAGLPVEVYTSDKDYLQLVSDKVEVNLLKVGMSQIQKVTPENIVALFGYTAAQTVDFKGLRGDMSDNLSGIPGIGEKTAVKLLAKYGTFENIVAHAGEIGGKTGEAIREHAEDGRLSYRLAEIKRDVELPFGLDDLLYRGYDLEKAASFARKYEMSTLMRSLPSTWGRKAESKAEILGKSDLSSLLSAKTLGVYPDLESELYHEAAILGLALSDGKRGIYLTHEDIEASKEELAAFFGNPEKEVLAYSYKELHYVFKRLGLPLLAAYEDLLSVAYLLSPDIAGAKDKAYMALGATYAFDKGERATSSLALAAAHFSYPENAKRLKEEGLYDLYAQAERPLARLLAEMEEEGLPLDEKTLLRHGEHFARKRDEAMAKVYEIAGHEFNVNSPKQVAEVLFLEKGLPDLKKGSTGVEVLSELAKSYELPSAILLYRKYAKLCSTYIDGLLPHLGPDGRIHTYFNQALTATGRLSSSDPNLQNIASKDEEGSLVKDAFFYDDGSLFLSLDYSQIELRVLASLSSCPSYIDTFLRGIDVHEETARKIFRVEAPTHLERQKAKAVNFAVIYGSTAYGLSQQIGCSMAEAQELVGSFYEHYPEVKNYLDGAVEFAKKHGYCSTLFGRRRYLPDLNSKLRPKAEAARRQALNAPVQGTAADIIKMAMLKCAALLKEGNYKTKMVLQIHDELIFKVPPEEKEAVLPLLREAMEKAVELKAPLKVAGGYGKTWKECKD